MGFVLGMVMIQALNVDKAEPWLDGSDCEEDEALPSDVTDEEWEQFAPLMPQAGRRGRPREVDFREVINAVRCLVGSGPAGGCCRFTLGRGRRSTAGFANWRD